MTTIYKFLDGWRELIVRIFSEYPLAAALVTIMALGVLYGLQTEWRRKQLKSNLLIVLLGWSILVPIVGFVMTLLGKVWAIIEAIAPIVTTTLGSFYHIYEQHPYLVLIVLVLGVAGFFGWNRWWPRRQELIQNRYLRILCVAMAIVVVVHIASPIANLFSPAPTTSSQPANADQKKAH